MRVSGGSCLWVCGLFFISSFFLFVYGSVQSDDEWIDPYDMINYDSTSKTMRKPAEVKKKKKGRSLQFNIQTSCMHHLTFPETIAVFF